MQVQLIIIIISWSGQLKKLDTWHHSYLTLMKKKKKKKQLYVNGNIYFLHKKRVKNKEIFFPNALNNI